MKSGRPSGTLVRGRRAGYTLLEILTVIAILGIVTLVVIPTFLSSDDDTRTRLAAQEITDALRFAQGDALRTNSSRAVIVNTLTEVVTVLEEATLQPLSHPSTKADYTLEFTGDAPYGGVDIVSFAGAGIRSVTVAGTAYNALVFQGDGHPSGDAEIIVSYAGQQKSILVDGATGRVIAQ